MSQPRLHCALYTRKSSEEGLEQAFNSLDAQREACAAYVKSQAGEGWRAVPTRYDDGGFSGASMERPALKRLLCDIEAGKVDVIVVYKIDRLTRSLADFARMIEIFDRRRVSFVSVTQAFNTTTSMGRLTLNCHEPHGGALCRLDDRGRVVTVILLPFQEWLDIDRRDQLARVAKSENLSTPVMRAAAGLHHNQARRRFGEEYKELFSRKLFAEHRLAFRRCPMELETPL